MTSKKKRIWVVDDDVSIGWVLERALKRKGYEVAVFRGVKPLLLALKNQHPDAVLSDIQMPGVDGLKLLELMHENFPSIPVIIMTAYSDFETTIKSYRKGAFEYLAKPFDLTQVQAVVERAIGQSATIREANPARQDAKLMQISARAHWERELSQHVDSLLNVGQQDIGKILTPQIERILITSALNQYEGHKQNAAKALGWGRNTLTRKMQELGM